MWNLRGTLALLLGRDNAALVNGLAYLGFAIGVVAIAWLWRRGWPRRGDPAARGRRQRASCRAHDRPDAPAEPAPEPARRHAGSRRGRACVRALRGTSGGRIIGVGALLAPVAILVVNGIAADAPTTLPIRLPTVLLGGSRRGHAHGSVVEAFPDPDCG